MTPIARCPGCGAVFQQDRPSDPGFLPAGKEPEEGVLCKRCFQITHYGLFRKAPINDQGIQEQLKKAASVASAIFLVFDVSRPEESYGDLKILEDFHKPVFVVANKVDLLEPWENRRQIHSWISDQTAISPEQILLVSVRNRRDMAELRYRIRESFSLEESLLFYGAANVGKSTLLGELLKSNLPTVSRLPGTTVGLVSHPMADGPTLIDAPGLGGRDSWLPLLCPHCLAALSPKKELTETTVILKASQIVTFGGLAHIAVQEVGDRGWIGLGIFAPDTVSVHRTNRDRLAELLRDHCGDLLMPPCRSCADALASVPQREEIFQVHCGDDLVVPGLGWVAIYSGYGRLVLRAPEFLKGAIRPWLISSPKQRTGKRRPRR